MSYAYAQPQYLSAIATPPALFRSSVSNRPIARPILKRPKPKPRPLPPRRKAPLILRRAAATAMHGLGLMPIGTAQPKKPAAKPKPISKPKPSPAPIGKAVIAPPGLVPTAIAPPFATPPGLLTVTNPTPQPAPAPPAAKPVTPAATAIDVPAVLKGHPVLVDKFKDLLKAGASIDSALAQAIAFDAARALPQLPQNKPGKQTPATSSGPTVTNPTAPPANAPVATATAAKPGAIAVPAALQGHPVLAQKYKDAIKAGASTDAALQQAIEFDFNRAQPQLVQNKIVVPAEFKGNAQLVSQYRQLVHGGKSPAEAFAQVRQLQQTTNPASIPSPFAGNQELTKMYRDLVASGKTRDEAFSQVTDFKARRNPQTIQTPFPGKPALEKYYRNLIAAGATPDEALQQTLAFDAARQVGGSSNPQDRLDLLDKLQPSAGGPTVTNPSAGGAGSAPSISVSSAPGSGGGSPIIVPGGGSDFGTSSDYGEPYGGDVYDAPQEQPAASTWDANTEDAGTDEEENGDAAEEDYGAASYDEAGDGYGEGGGYRNDYSNVSGLGLTLRKFVGTAAPVAGVALAPFTGGASLAIGAAAAAAAEKKKKAPGVKAIGDGPTVTNPDSGASPASNDKSIFNDTTKLLLIGVLGVAVITAARGGK